MCALKACNCRSYLFNMECFSWWNLPVSCTSALEPEYEKYMIILIG